MSATQRSPNDLVEIFDGLEVSVGERLVDECPKMLGGLQFGAVGTLENEPDPFGHDQIFWAVASRLRQAEAVGGLAHPLGGRHQIVAYPARQDHVPRDD